MTSDSEENKRLREINAVMLEALKLAAQIIGHPDDQMSKHIANVIRKAEGLPHE